MIELVQIRFRKRIVIRKVRVFDDKWEVQNTRSALIRWLFEQYPSPYNILHYSESIENVFIIVSFILDICLCLLKLLKPNTYDLLYCWM